MSHAYMFQSADKPWDFVPALRLALGRDNMNDGRLYKKIGGGQVFDDVIFYRFEARAPLDKEVEARLKHGNAGMNGFTKWPVREYAGNSPLEWREIDLTVY